MTTATQQEGVVKATGPYPVPERFKEQLAIMPDSISAPLKEQLTLMPDSAVVEIYQGGHKVSILYKTNAQSREANARQDSVRTVNGANKALPIAKAKLGDEYVTEQGEVETFTLGKLAEFQATGLIIVMVVIIGIMFLTYFMSYVMNKVITPILSKKEKAPVAAKAAPAAAASSEPIKIDLSKGLGDPDAPSVHPGFTNKQLQAFLSIAAVSALEIHPGLSNEKLAVIFAVAAAEVLGGPVKIVKFKSQNSTEWAWTTQGRTELQSNGL
ncbi:MAG: hypothetical protein K6A31_07890 [Fibrobacter sp.]|nr:hypothetical protein [Fibrobacter sp.]